MWRQIVTARNHRKVARFLHEAVDVITQTVLPPSKRSVYTSATLQMICLTLSWQRRGVVGMAGLGAEIGVDPDICLAVGALWCTLFWMVEAKMPGWSSLCWDGSGRGVGVFGALVL